MQNSVNHRTFERNWRFQVPPGSMFLRVAPPPAWARALRASDRGRRGGLSSLLSAAFRAGSRSERRREATWRARSSCHSDASCAPDVLGFALKLLIVAVVACAFQTLTDAAWRGRCMSSSASRHPFWWCVDGSSVGVPSFFDPPSNEARLPAELKHITKRRRRN